MRVLAAYILHTTSVHHTYTCTLYVRTYVHIIVLLHVHTYTRTMYLHTYIAYGMYMIPCIVHVACVVDTHPQHAQKRTCSWCACVALTTHHLSTQDDALLVAVVHKHTITWSKRGPLLVHKRWCYGCTPQSTPFLSPFCSL